MTTNVEDLAEEICCPTWETNKYKLDFRRDDLETQKEQNNIVTVNKNRTCTMHFLLEKTHTFGKTYKTNAGT